MQRVLVVGYGNIMRRDDAAGVHAAHQLEERYRDCGEVRVIAAHQLTPELAEDLADAKYVLFLDAAAANPPGKIVEAPLAADGVVGALEHSVSPGALLVFSEQLYGEAPSAFVLTINGSSFEVGTGISPVVSAMMGEFVSRAMALINSWLGMGSVRYAQAMTMR